MSNLNYYRRYTLLVVVTIGIFLGIILAALWALGLITSIHLAIPTATTITLVILALTPLLWVLSRPTQVLTTGAENPYHTHMMNTGGYVRVITASAIIFLLFVLTYQSTTLTFAVKVILAFIAGSAIWVMILAFVAYVFGLSRRI